MGPGLGCNKFTSESGHGIGSSTLWTDVAFFPGGAVAPLAHSGLIS